jgi:hypothetical protein
MTDVKCKVQTCHYWGTNDICKADGIMVDNNTGSTVRSTRMEAGDLDVNNRSRNRGIDMKSASSGFEAADLNANVATQTRTQSNIQAHSSHETLCSTFRQKGSEPRH